MNKVINKGLEAAALLQQLWNTLYFIISHFLWQKIGRRNGLISRMLFF